ncbi:MAG: DUF4340 domain-containing protein [Chloroflexi bacterium]|nr:DUF4340 domain-containing protein [Chloroflexota bacterium]
MNYRVTLGFLVAAAILAVLVFGLDKFNIGPTPTANANATSTTTAAQQPQIFSFDDSKVTTFLLRQAGQSVQVDRQNGTWVVDGSGDVANQASFNSLVTRMSQMKATRAVDNPGDLSQYGLDSPNESAIATLDDGTKYQLDLGNKTPVQTGTYAKTADAPAVYVIPDQFQSDLERLVADPKQPPTPTPAPPTTTASPGAAVLDTGTPTP